MIFRIHADGSSTQDNPEQIDKIWKMHMQQRASLQASANKAKEEKNRFTPEFIAILMRNAPESLKLKLSLLQSPHCPDEKNLNFYFYTDHPEAVKPR